MLYDSYIADSNLAFGGGNFETALEYAKKAIKEKPKETEGYFCAGKACMSMSKLDDAIKYFQKAIDINEKNGNGYFLLGYANAMAGNTIGALKGLTRALENNCDETLKGQIYKMMSMINIDQGDHKNALLNLEQAEEFIGLDYELLKQKAACYASLKDYRQTIFILNQMKLIQPNDYSTYSLAFHIFMDLGIYDEAKAELGRAEDFAELNMTYYNDRVAYALMHDLQNDTEESISQRWKDVLFEIDTALTQGQPNAEQVFEMYLRAAQMYLSLKQPDESIKCLDAAENPVMNFNNDFSVLMNESDSISTEIIPDNISLEEEEELMQEKWDNGEFDDISEKIEDLLYDVDSDDSEEIAEAVQKYLSPSDQIPEKEKDNEDIYFLAEAFTMDSLQKDMRNSLYLSAYEFKKDYDNMLNKARELQASDIIGNQYDGIYHELKVGKYKNNENWQKKYRERINFWTKRMMEDPTDYLSASYRIRSYIDLEDYNNAEQLCSCLPADIKKPLMEELQKAKSKGGGDNGNTSE